jgi:pectate disaccharide-lyase
MKVKRSLALMLVLLLLVSMIQVPVFASTEASSGHPQPNITISGDSTFVRGGSFSFGVTSDMGGALSVSVGGLDGMAVASQPITAHSEFTVQVPAMPDVSSSEIVVVVRPDNPLGVDLEQAAVTGMKIFTVTASSGEAASSLFSLAAAPEAVSPVEWTSMVFGTSVENSGEEAGSVTNSVYNPSNTVAVDPNTGHITLTSVGDKGKIQGSSDGMNYYYTTIDSSKDFRISAIMKVSEMKVNNQTAAGLMIRDAFGASATSYDGASKMLMGGWFQTSSSGAANPTAYRAASSLVRPSNPSTMNMETGVDYRVEMVKVGNSYTVYVSSGNKKDSVTMVPVSTIGLSNTPGKDLYVGAFTSRNATATFKDLTIEELTDSKTPASLTITPPVATSFIENTTPDWSDMVVNYNTLSGATNAVPSTDYYISGYDNLTVGTRAVTVYYRGVSATFPYTVNYDYSLNLYVPIPPLKNTYAVGEAFDRTGIEIRSNNASGKQTVMKEGTAEGNYTLHVPAFDTAGKKTITATRSGANTGGNPSLTVAFDVEVKDITVDRLEISQPPLKTSYYVGDTSFDASGTASATKKLLTGSIVKAVLSDGSAKIIPMDTGDGAGYAVSYTTPNADFVKNAGTSKVTLSYAGKSVDVDFEIIHVAHSKLVATAYPQTTYIIGDTIDLSGMVVKAQNNDGSYNAELVAGTDYNAVTTAIDMSQAGLYHITLQGMGSYDGLTGTVPVSVRAAQDYTTGWQQVTFGQSASKGPNNVVTVIPEANDGTVAPGTIIDLETKNGAGKLADGHDGINYYYQRLHKDDNFKLTANVKVITFSNPDGKTAIYGQEAFGLMARDRIATDGDTSVWSSSMFMAGARGSTAWNALYRDNRTEYIGGATSTNQNMPNTSTTGTISAFDRLGQTGTGNTATLTIERKNNNWSAIIQQGTNVKTYSIDNDIPLDYYDSDYIYVGFFTARNAHIEVSNVELSVTSAAADLPGPIIAQKAVTPSVTVRSAANTTSSDYNLVYTSTAEGTANIYLNSNLVATQEVKANVPMTQPVKLGDVGSKNGIVVEFFPSTSQLYSNYERIVSPIPVSVVQGFDTLYVSPAGGGNGQTSAAPTTFADAVSKLAPGGTIYLLSGNYGGLTLPRFNDGTATAYKKVIGQAGVKATSLNVQGNFWHVKNLEVAGGSVSISGNDNRIEMIHQHGSTNTGIQIARGDAATQPSLAYWPSRNVVLNSEAYDNRDASENDADGFAAKLTSGVGNKFIGTVAHHNIDDGWDLYAKSVPIGPVTLDYSIAYANGHSLSHPDTNGGDGNGFKLGGEGVPVAHSISNSIAFANKSSGYTSNSNPTLSATNNVSFDNGGANISFVSYSNIPVREYVINGFYSYRKDTASTVTVSDVIESIEASTIVKTDGRKQYTNDPHSIYLWDGASMTSTNDLGRQVTDDFFVSLTMPSDYQTAQSVFERDANVTNEVPSGAYSSNLLFGDFLKLTSLAKDHTYVWDVTFDANGGAFSDRSESKALPAYYDVAKGNAFVTQTLPVATRNSYDFAGWTTSPEGKGTRFTSSTPVSGSGLVVYADWIETTEDGTGGKGSTGGTGGIGNAPNAAGTPTLDTTTGEARLAVEAKTITDAFSQATTDNSGIKTISLVIPKVDGAASYTSVLPAAALTSADAAQRVELKTDLGSVVVPGNMLANTAVAAKEIGINIGAADTSKLSAEVRAQIGNRPVINLNVTADGQRVEYNNPDAPVKVAIPYKPSAEELKNSEHIVVWYVDDSGKAVPVPNGKYDAATETVVFTTTHFSQYAIAYVFKTFDDISSYGWAKASIEVMASKGIINGMSDTAFVPGARITRADFTLLLVKSLGLSAKVDSNFSDVKTTDYYYEAVGTAKALGLAQGQGDNKFNPTQEISRQDMMVITARAMKAAKKLASSASADLSAFADQSDVADYAVSDISAMVKAGLIEGDNNGRINPLGNTTRAEAAVLMYRMYNK